MAEQHIQDLFEDRARKGDGQFAVAFALLELARGQERVAKALRSIAAGGSQPGGLEAVALELKHLGEAVTLLTRE
ncbi:hypothetical protein [Flavisphingomonas formosensis]|uniref:hypothetical protein n=1 Tax=Flavisphingomonas formosensis TaxID=861534 RepID=UPI0012F9DD21|nr:hypothetical protein [Sphingomonas formosensis]